MFVLVSSWCHPTLVVACMYYYMINIVVRVLALLIFMLLHDIKIAREMTFVIYIAAEEYYSTTPQ